MEGYNQSSRLMRRDTADRLEDEERGRTSFEEQIIDSRDEAQNIFERRNDDKRAQALVNVAHILIVLYANGEYPLSECERILQQMGESKLDAPVLAALATFYSDFASEENEQFKLSKPQKI